MNSLSWLIYAAEVLGRVSVSFFFIALIAAVGTGALIFIAMLARADAQSDTTASYRSEDGRKSAALRVEFWDKVLASWPKRSAAVAVVFGALSIVAPSNSTIYMIAASEMGEKVATTPEAKEMLGDLREVIAKQIKKLKDDK